MLWCGSKWHCTKKMVAFSFYQSLLLSDFFLLPLAHNSGGHKTKRGSGNSGVTDASEKKQDWLDSLLGNSKKGVFTADFEEVNGTTVEVRDGTQALLNCRVYLRHDKTVRTTPKNVLYYKRGMTM